MKSRLLRSGFRVAMAIFLMVTTAVGDGLRYVHGKEPVAEVTTFADHAWNSPLFGFGVKTNDVYTDGNAFLSVPLWSTIGTDGTLGGNYLFLEPYGSLGEGGEVATSLGLGYRHLFNHEPVSALQKRGMARFMEEGWFLGGSLFVDRLQTQHDNTFWQLGVGAEIGNRYLQFRGNYYIPLTGEKLVDRQVNTQSFTSSSTVLRTTGAGAGAPYASGNQIAQDISQTVTAETTFRTTTIRTVTELFEKGMEGWDVEGSVLVPWVDQWADVRLIGGYFSFDNQPFGPQSLGTGPVRGWKSGIEVRPVPAIVLNATWYGDKRLTGGDWTAGIQFQIPLDRTWKDSFQPRRRHLVEQMAEPVRRQNDAVKIGNRDEQNSASSTSARRVTRIVAQDSQHLVLADDVIFVNNGGPVGNGIEAGSAAGTGSAAQPLDTVQAATNLAVTNNTTTNRVWNVYTQGTAVPYSESINVGGSVAFISSGSPLMGKGGKAFGAGAKPLVTGGFAATSIPYMGIAGYEITGGHAGTSNGITATSVSALELADLNIHNTSGAGIVVSGASIATSIRNSIIADTGSDGLRFDTHSGNAATVGVNITNAGGAGVLIDGGSGTKVFSGSAIINATAAAFSVSGGTANIFYGGSMNQANNSPLVEVFGAHTGTATFAGSLAATNGTGLQFDNADGAYNFFGATTLHGGDAGIDIANGSGGNFFFGGGTSIINPAGVAYFESNSTANVTYNGSIIQSSDAPAVAIDNKTGGVTSFNGSVTANVPNANAVDLFSNPGGTIQFNGALTLKTGNGTAFSAANGGTIRVAATAANQSIDTIGGFGLFLSNVTFDSVHFDSIKAGDGLGSSHSAVTLDGTSGGTFSVGGIVSKGATAADAISLQNLATGTYAFNGVTTVSDVDTFHSAVSISGVGIGASISFASLVVDNVDSAPAVILDGNLGAIAVNDGSVNHVNNGSAFFIIDSNASINSVTIGDSATSTVASGIHILNNDGISRTVSLTNNNIRVVENAITSVDAGNAKELILVLNGNILETTGPFTQVMNLKAFGPDSTIVKSFNGGTIIGNATGGAGVLIQGVTFDASGASLLGTQVAGGTWNIGTTANRVEGEGMVLLDNSGSLKFTQLNIATNDGDALVAETLGTSFALEVSGGAINSLGGAAMELETLTGNLTFNSVTSTNSVCEGIIITNVAGTVKLGTVNITNSLLAGILVDSSAANVSATTITINATSESGIVLTGNTGSFTVTGLTSITNAAFHGIDLGGLTANSTVTFGAVNINGFGSSDAGINFAGADVTATFGVTNIQNSGANIGTGTGIDLSNTQNGRLITFATGSSITAVATGVQLSGGGLTANANFVFGDGSAVIPNGKNSTINATTTVDGANLNSASGNYNFLDVNFTGASIFPALPGGTLYFVNATGSGTADGSSIANAATISTANTHSAANLGTTTTYVLVNNAGIISLGASTFTLGANDRLDSFGNGNSFSTGAPINVQGFGGLITNANGAATLSGTATLVALADNNFVQNLTISGGTTDFTGSGITGFTFAGNSLTGGSTAVFAFTNAAGTVTVNNSTINAGGQLLTVTGGSAAIQIAKGTGTTLAGTGVSVQNTTGGSVTITDAVLTPGAGIEGVLLVNNAASVNFVGGSINNSAGVRALHVNGGAASVTYGGSITNSAGNSVLVENRTGSTVDVTGAINDTGAGILVQNNIGGTIFFSNPSKVLNTGANTAVTLTNNTGATINFTGGGLDLDTTTATAFSASGGGTINVTGAGNSITTATGQILSWNNLDVGASDVTFASMSATGTVGNDAIILNNVDGAGTFNGGTVTVAATSGGASDGLRIVGGSTATFGFGTTTIGATAGDGVELNGANGAVTFSSLTVNGAANQGVSLIGATNAININGGAFGNTNDPDGNTLFIQGGSGDINIAASINKSTTNNVVFITGRTAGTVTLSGDITTSTGGIAVVNNTGGTVNFTGQTISGTGATSGMQLSNNTGATININPTAGGSGFDLSTSTGNAFSATGGGTITVQGTGNSLTTTTGTAVNISNTMIGALGVTFASISTNGAANGILLDTIGSTGAFTANGGSIVGATTRGVDINGGDADVTYAGSISTSGGAARSVEVTGRTGGTVAFSGAITDTSLGINVAGSTGGTVTFSGATKTLNTGANQAVTLANNTGATINFTNGGLDIDTTTGLGFGASGGGTVNVSGAVNTITTTSGKAVDISGITAGMTFTSITSMGSASQGLNVALNSGSFAVTGTTAVTNSAGGAIKLAGSAVTFNFGTTNITNAGADGIDLTALTGNSTANFGATTLNGFGAASIGVNFTGADVTSAFGVTSIQNGGNGTGIDLSSTLNNRTITFAKTSSITGVATGVQLSLGGTTATTANANFTFGDGEGIVDKASTITASTTVNAVGLDPASGIYNFQDVNFTGTPAFPAPVGGALYFVNGTGSGTGDGSSIANAATITTANTHSSLNLGTITTYVLVNNAGTINLGAATFTLGANDRLDGFGNGNTFSNGVPANVLGFGGPITDANGAATLAGTGTLVTLANANFAQNLVFSAGTIGFSGTGINGFTFAGSTLTGGSTAAFAFSGATGTISINNSTITASGLLLDVSGGSATIQAAQGTGTSLSGKGISVSGMTGGSVTVTNAALSSNGNTAVTLNGNAATVTLTNLAVMRTAGDTAFDIDATIASTSTITLNGTSSIDSTAGAAFLIGAGARDIVASGVNFTNTGTTAANVIRSTGQTGGTISFGNVGITAFNNAAGTAVSLAGTGGTVTFTDLDIATTAGAGLNVGGITFAPGASATISAAGANALTMNGTTLNGGTATFSSVTSSGGTNGISLTNVTGATTFSTVAISSSTGDGVFLSNAGTVNISGGTINGTGANGIKILNTAGTLDSITFGNTAAIIGNGINVDVTDSVSRLLDITVVTMSNIIGKGILYTHTGTTAQTLSISSTAISSGGNAIEIVKAGAGALNFSLDNSALASSTGMGLLFDADTGAGVATVTSLANNQVSAAVSGGMIFETVTFDATPGGAIQQVAVGDINIGPVSAGDGLRLNNVLGDLAVSTLNITNTGGTGLFIRDAGGKLGSFAFGNTGGTINTTNGTAMDIDPVAMASTFTGVSSTNASVGIKLDTISGTVNLGNVTVTNPTATGTGLLLINSSAAVTAGTVNMDGAAVALQFGVNTGGSFTATGATTLTNIGVSGINANGATGTYSFKGVTMVFTGAVANTRGIDLRGSSAQFETDNLSIAGNGTATSIGLDLSGSLYPGGQPVTNNAPNIRLAVSAGESAVFTGFNTGVKLGEAGNSAHAYLRYGNQTSGSSIDVISGGVTIDTANLTATSAFQEGRYEFVGVTYGAGDKATFENSNPNFIFVGTNAAGAANGGTPDNRISIATFLASDNTAVFLAGKTVVLVNDDNVNGISLGGVTLNMGTNTILDGFGNGNTVVVPGGVQPINVFGTFTPGGGNFTDAAGAATLKATGVNVVTLANGNIIQNVNIANGTNNIFGSGIAGFTIGGTTLSGGTLSGINLTGATGTIIIGSNNISSTGSAVNIVSPGASDISLAFDNNTLTSATGAGANLSGAGGPGDFVITSFSGNTVIGTAGGVGGILVSTVLFDQSAAAGIQQVAGGNTTIGTTGSRVQGDGLRLDFVLGSIGFGTLNIANNLGTGLYIRDAAGKAGAFAFSNTGGTIDTTNGAAMDIDPVAMNSTFSSVSSTGGTNGINLDTISGTVIINGGSISGSTGAAFRVNGGTVSVTYSGGITQGSNAALVSVTGHSTGTITFNTGTLSATNGTGLQFDNADGTYNFNNTTVTLNGGDAGIDIVNGSSGTFVFGTGAGFGLANPTGTGFNFNASTATVTYNGILQKNNAGALVDITGQASGTITFQSGTLSASAGTGINLNNVDGAVNFNSVSTSLTGGNAHVDINNGSSGTINFASGTAISNPTGVAFREDTSTANVTFNGAITQNNAANAVQINAKTGGATTFGGLVTANTSTATAINLTGNTGATISFNGGLNIDTTSGTGFAASGGTINVAATAGDESVNSTGAQAISLNGIAAGITFDSVSSGGGVNGVGLTSVTGTVTMNGGTLSGASGATFNVVGGTVSTTYSGNITQGNNAALVSVSGGHATGTVTFDTGTLTATNGTGLQFDGADGTYNFNGPATISGGDAGIDILNGSGGTFKFGTNSGFSITSPTGTAFNFSASSGGVTYNGILTQNNAALLVNITDQSGGTITFQTSTISAGAGSGINLSNADGTVNFNGITTLNGGNAHVDINTGSGGTIGFGTGASITSPSGSAFVFNGSTAGVTYSGNITQATASQLMVDITNQASGTITFQTGTLGATNGTGIDLSNVDGTVNFNGSTTLNGGNAHIDINTGSSGTIAFASGASVGATTAPTGVAFREDTSTAGVTYNGTLRQTNAANAVFINAKTGGTTTFGGAITAATTTANAINLTSNTGGTINFNGNTTTGGLTITTTSGIGFNATGGGTVNVTQNNTSIVNTISSTSGTALNFVSTTIGASGLTFRSINAGTAAGSGGVGILLSDTGNNAGLTVTGNGTAGSGGTIQHKTGADPSAVGNITVSTQGIGILLLNTLNPSFSRMQLNDFDNFAIYGGTVNGFALSNSTINGANGNNNGFDEGNVIFDGLTGTATMSANALSGQVEDNFRVRNSSGTLNLTINGSSNFTGTASSNDNIILQGTGNANITAHIQNNTFTSAGGDQIQTAMGEQSSGTFVITNNTFTNPASGSGSLGGGITISGGNSTPVPSTETVRFNVSNNNLSGAVQGGGININLGNGNGNWQGQVSGNTISDIVQSSGIRVENHSITGTSFAAGQHAVLTAIVDGNTITNWGSGPAINSQAGEAAISFTELNLTVTNNNASSPGALTQHGFVANIGAGANTTTSQDIARLDIRGNHLDGSMNGGFDLRVRQRGASTVVLPGYSGGIYDTSAVANYLIANNAGETTGNATSSAGPGFIGGTVPTPTVPTLLFASGGSPASGSGATLTQTSLNALGNAAISRWTGTGLTVQQLTLLNGITFGIADLPTGYLGEALPGQVLLSSNAAGNSWFIDSTPFDDNEFTGSGTQLTATSTSGAAGQVDALTVILHELGHQLGLDDTYLSSNSSSIMYGYLTLGERRLPAFNQALGATPPTGPFADAMLIAPSSSSSSSILTPALAPNAFHAPSWIPSNTNPTPLGSSTFQREDVKPGTGREVPALMRPRSHGQPDTLMLPTSLEGDLTPIVPAASGLELFLKKPLPLDLQIDPSLQPFLPPVTQMPQNGYLKPSAAR